MVGLLLQHLVKTLQDVWVGVTMTWPCLSNYLRAWDPNCILELVRPLMTFPGEACGHWVRVPGHSGFELCQQSNCGAVCQSVLHHPSIHRHVVRRFYLDSFFWALCTFVHLSAVCLGTRIIQILWWHILHLSRRRSQRAVNPSCPELWAWLCREKQIADLPPSCCLPLAIWAFYRNHSVMSKSVTLPLREVGGTVEYFIHHLADNTAQSMPIGWWCPRLLCTSMEKVTVPRVWQAPAIPHGGLLPFLWDWDWGIWVEQSWRGLLPFCLSR